MSTLLHGRLYHGQCSAVYTIAIFTRASSLPFPTIFFYSAMFLLRYDDQRFNAGSLLLSTKTLKSEDVAKRLLLPSLSCEQSLKDKSPVLVISKLIIWRGQNILSANHLIVAFDGRLHNRLK